jgi:hypothetical protein
MLQFNTEELISTTQYLTLYARHRIRGCRYNRVQLYLLSQLIAICLAFSPLYLFMNILLVAN